jgi:membrane protease YdiL (CAAX protease family)
MDTRKMIFLPHNIVTYLLVGGLIILRMPILTGITIVNPNSSIWVLPLYEIGTYFLTAILIWWERDHLADYHIDKLAFIIIIGKPLELLLYKLDLPFAFPSMSIAYILVIPISLTLILLFWLARPTLPKLSRRIALWIFIGILAGIVLGIYGGILTRIFYKTGIADHFTVTILIFFPIQQMLYAGISEEPLFRGFLWGILRKLGVKELWILFIQAGLFWLGHLFHIIHGVGFSFWLFIPIASLVFGLLAWRSRSITISIIAHGLSNSILQIIAFYYLH